MKGGTQPSLLARSQALRTLGRAQRSQSGDSQPGACGCAGTLGLAHFVEVSPLPGLWEGGQTSPSLPELGSLWLGLNEPVPSVLDTSTHRLGPSDPTRAADDSACPQPVHLLVEDEEGRCSAANLHPPVTLPPVPLAFALHSLSSFPSSITTGLLPSLHHFSPRLLSRLLLPLLPTSLGPCSTFLILPTSSSL